MNESPSHSEYLLEQELMPKHRVIERQIRGTPGNYTEGDRGPLEGSLMAQGIAHEITAQMVDLMMCGLNLYVDNGKPALFTGSADPIMVKAALKRFPKLDFDLKKLLVASLERESDEGRIIHHHDI